MQDCLQPWSGRSVFFCAMFVFLCPPALHAEEPFDYYQNSWNVIGLKDYIDGTRITPDNQLQLAGGGKAALSIGVENTPLSRKQTKTLLDGWMPIVLLSAQDGAVQYDFTLWATPLPTVKDWQKAFDWPTEGENYLNWIAVKATNTGKQQADAKVTVNWSRASAPKWSFNTGRLLPANRANGACGFPLRQSPMKGAGE